MKHSRFTKGQIIATIKKLEAGMVTAEVRRKHGVSSASFYNYKAKYGGMDVSGARKLKALEDKNAKLKKLLAKQMLDNAILKMSPHKRARCAIGSSSAERTVTPDAKREAVVHACKTHGVSQRRACEVLGVDRTSVRYQSIRPNDQHFREAMKAVAAERRRFGYRRIHVMLERQGIRMNQKSTGGYIERRGFRYANVAVAKGL